MIVLQRRNKIKEMLMHERSVKVADLVKEFNISEETIRRDLYQLEQEGFVKREYGGAILSEDIQNAFTVPQPIQQRKFQNFDEKDEIGKKAAELVQDEQILVLDSGSTTWCVARYLRNHRDLMIVTNGVNIVEECSYSDNSSVYLVGGKLIKKSMSIVGPQAVIELQKYNAHFAFLGTSGISLHKGFTSSDIFEAEVKRAMISAGQKVVIVADHTKLQRQAIISFGSFKEVDILITSDLADEKVVQEIENQGVQVIVCPMPSTQKK